MRGNPAQHAQAGAQRVAVVQVVVQAAESQDPGVTVRETVPKLRVKDEVCGRGALEQLLGPGLPLEGRG